MATFKKRKFGNNQIREKKSKFQSQLQSRTSVEQNLCQKIMKHGIWTTCLDDIGENLETQAKKIAKDYFHIGNQCPEHLKAIEKAVNEFLPCLILIVLDYCFSPTLPLLYKHVVVPTTQDFTLIFAISPCVPVSLQATSSVCYGYYADSAKYGDLLIATTKSNISSMTKFPESTFCKLKNKTFNWFISSEFYYNWKRDCIVSKVSCLRKALTTRVVSNVLLSNMTPAV